MGADQTRNQVIEYGLTDKLMGCSQIQHITDAVHLDCLFTDEGSGRSTPEAFRTVSDAIHGVQVGGRIVGVITNS